MNQYAMHNMVEYIKTQAEFPFDALDVDESLEAILDYFGFHPQLDASDSEQLRQDLYPLALSTELGEMQHLAEAEGMEELESVGKPLGMWLRVLGRQERSITPARFMEKMRLA
jgi:hypothetical protein